MKPREYEELVAEVLRSEGWDVAITPTVGDYGVDLFASRDGRRLAVQVKMYGGTTRRVNRAMIMQLHGAAAYFDCTGALLATDGTLLPDAQEVADKLGIEIRSVAADSQSIAQTRSRASDALDFDSVWEKFIVPLEGTTIRRPDGRSNDVLQVDWSGIRRRTSNGKTGFIGIEIFRSMVTRLLNGETVTRAEINDEYTGRASSGVLLILSQIPLFEVSTSPASIRAKTADS
jgi:restriction system protein